MLLFALAFRQASPASDAGDELKAQLNYVASALTAGDASDAMTPFAKSFAQRETLGNYFAGLVGAFAISNEIDFLDEKSSGTECSGTVRWALTLTDLQSNNTERRSAELKVRLIREKGRWKIGDLTPLTIFNPSNIAPKPVA